MISGGRMLADRAVLVPWGDVPSGGEASVRSSREKPWPGRLPGPSPATVFSPPRPVTVQSASGVSVDVDERGTVTAPPVLFGLGNRRPAEVDAWAGPWPMTERWWDSSAARRLNRFQLVDSTGAAWLLVLENHNWFAEGFYD
jgi:protein ImuB